MKLPLAWFFRTTRLTLEENRKPRVVLQNVSSESLRYNSYCSADEVVRTIVFMHVPKSGGLSLVNSIRDAGRNTYMAGFDKSLFGAFTEFSSILPPVSNQIFVDGSSHVRGDFVAGHMALSTLASRFPSASFMTVLRHPCIRLLSLFLYWRSRPEQELKLWGRWAERLRRSHGPLSNFLRAPDIACQTDNVVARLLLWPHRAIRDYDFILPEEHDEIYEEARQKIDRFKFVDLVENPSFEVNLSTWLNRPFALRRDNQTIPRPDLPIFIEGELDDETRRLLKRLTAINSQLWIEFANRRGIHVSADEMFDVYIEQVQNAWASAAPSAAVSAFKCLHYMRPLGAQCLSMVPMAFPADSWAVLSHKRPDVCS